MCKCADWLEGKKIHIYFLIISDQWLNFIEHIFKCVKCIKNHVFSPEARTIWQQLGVKLWDWKPLITDGKKSTELKTISDPTLHPNQNKTNYNPLEKESIPWSLQNSTHGTHMSILSASIKWNHVKQSSTQTQDNHYWYERFKLIRE